MGGGGVGGRGAEASEFAALRGGKPLGAAGVGGAETREVGFVLFFDAGGGGGDGGGGEGGGGADFGRAGFFDPGDSFDVGAELVRGLAKGRSRGWEGGGGAFSL